MSAQGIPQVSDELAMDIKFKFTLNGTNGKEWVDARIIGFTNEVASILVPESFMSYGNNKYSDGKDKKITQLMISGKEGEFGRVEELMKKRGLESKNSQMVVGRLKSIVGTLVLVVLGISVIAVFVSGLVLIQYLQLLMSRNAYEVRTLMRIGYHPKELIKAFTIYFIKVFGIVAAVGLSLFFLLKYFLDDMFVTGGIYLDTSLSYQSVLALALSYILFSWSSYRTARNGIFKEY
jgi:ABC-type antimicrobial peptide transport system permease subunit